MSEDSQEITLDDVVGLEKQKTQIYNTLILPLEQKELKSKLILQPDKVKARKNFLFYGPPGTGKTFFAKAISNTYDIPFTFVQSTQFINQFVGAGAESMRKLYSSSNGILYLDEFDAIASNNLDKKDDLRIQLQMLLDGANTNYNITTIAATNKFKKLDEAILSRFPKQNRLYFEEPSEKQKKLIFEKQLSYYNHKIKSVNFLTNKEVNARDVEDLFSQAVISALTDKREYLLKEDFQ